MSKRPKLLDLFCGAGGAAMGYHRAGFDVIGVDIAPQPNYPFPFVQTDALQFARACGHLFDAVHASPPCQAYTTLRALQGDREYPDLVAATREALRATGLPYVIENVPRAPLLDPITLCGSSFGLDVRRHRKFESNLSLVGKPCDHAWQTPRFRETDKRREGRLASVVDCVGHAKYAGHAELRKRAMDIHWMTDAELVEAIPPAYTQHIGEQLLRALSSPNVEAA